MKNMSKKQKELASYFIGKVAILGALTWYGHRRWAKFEQEIEEEDLAREERREREKKEEQARREKKEEQARQEKEEAEARRNELIESFVRKHVLEGGADETLVWLLAAAPTARMKQEVLTQALTRVLEEALSPKTKRKVVQWLEENGPEDLVVHAEVDERWEQLWSLLGYCVRWGTATTVEGAGAAARNGYLALEVAVDLWGRNPNIEDASWNFTIFGTEPFGHLGRLMQAMDFGACIRREIYEGAKNGLALSYHLTPMETRSILLSDKPEPDLDFPGIYNVRQFSMT
jgi:hypothetical protein